MVDEDRRAEDKMREAAERFFQDLNLLAALYGDMELQAPDAKTRREASFARGAVKRLKDIYSIQLQQIEAHNEMARTIISLRQEINDLKSKVN